MPCHILSHPWPAHQLLQTGTAHMSAPRLHHNKKKTNDCSVSTFEGMSFQGITANEMTECNNPFNT